MTPAVVDVSRVTSAQLLQFYVQFQHNDMINIANLTTLPLAELEPLMEKLVASVTRWIYPLRMDAPLSVDIYVA